MKLERGICFEEIAYYIETGKIIDAEENSGYLNQKMYIPEIDNCAIAIPLVKTEDEIFLKTAFPSRKYTKQFGLEGEI
ncbi:MAG: DUF4258 domain-containing protein [Candidatus Anammoxibacter sp.]